MYRSSLIYYIIQNNQEQPPELFCKKRVLKSFAKFIEKHSSGPATLLKRDSSIGASYVFCNFFKNTLFTEHFGWLLLKIMNSSSYLRVLPIVAAK